MTKKVEEKKYVRPSWDEYFMEVMEAISKRATCDRGRSGCVIVKNKQILVTGYVGSPMGLPHCDEVGHQRNQLGIPSGERHEICRAIHAEQNAIIQAAKHGENIEGSTIYCTHSPCIICTKMMINSGVKRIVTYGEYPDIGGVKDLLKEAGVKLEKIDRPSDKINFLD